MDNQLAGFMGLHTEESLELLEIFPEYQRRGQATEVRILGITLPKADKIPTVRFDEAKVMVAQKYQRKEI